MDRQEPSVILLHPAESRPPKTVAVLAAEAAIAPDPGAVLLEAWRDQSLAGLRPAYVHGERHDLWWEFALARSLEASARDWDLAPSLFRWRMHWLVQELSLGPLLTERVMDLSPSERALANLAAALLRRPNVLLWDDPFVVMTQEDRARAVSVVDSLVQSEGLVVLASAPESGDLSSAGPREGFGPRWLGPQGLGQQGFGARPAYRLAPLKRRAMGR